MTKAEVKFWNRATLENESELNAEDLAKAYRFWRAYPLNRKLVKEQSDLHASEVKHFTHRAFEILRRAARRRGISTLAIKPEVGEHYQSAPEFDELFVMLEIEAKAKPPKGGDTKGATMTLEEKALAVLVAHPDWNDTQVAKKVRCNRRTLYKWERYKQAREALKSGRKLSAKGSKNRETGDIEAWD